MEILQRWHSFDWSCEGTHLYRWRIIEMGPLKKGTIGFLKPVIADSISLSVDGAN